MRSISPRFLVLAASLLVATSATRANAANSPSSPTREVSVAHDRVQTKGPNRTLLRAGLSTLGVSYVPAVIVAIESPLGADDNLYVPVAGPWLDYAQRSCNDCSHETFNKVMLVTDGIFQGLGALQVLGSFLFLETRVHDTSSKSRQLAKRSPALRITPAKLGKSAFGLTASGKF